jgi:hypothetical protein
MRNGLIGLRNSRLKGKKMDEQNSIVLKPRIPFDEALLAENKDALAEFLDSPVSAIVETIVGALSGGVKSWGPITGRVVQGALKGKLFQQVSREIEALRAAGKIPDDFAERKYGFQSWVELMSLLDQELPDADRLEALRATFYEINKTNAVDSDRVLAYQLFQIAKRLNSGELLLLRAVYDACKANDFTPGATPPLLTWSSRMAKRLGHGLSSLIEKDERALVDTGLISSRLNAPTVPQVIRDDNARLTDLGLKFCENIQNYRLELSRVE